MDKNFIRNTTLLAIPVVLAMYAVSYICSKIGVGITQLFSSVSISQTITPTFGNKIYSFISGLIPLNLTLPNIAILFLSAWATIILGTLLLGWSSKLAFLGNSSTGRLASLIFWGGVPVYLLLIGFKIPSITIFIASLVWILAVSYIAGFFGGLIKKI